MRTVLALGGPVLDTLPMPTPAASATLDDLDARLLALFTAQPQVGVLGASRELGVARGTVQARLDRLVGRGVIRSWAPQLDPAAMGYPVSAFCTLEIRQGRGHSPVVEHLSSIPEVLEAHTITGAGDLLVRVVARDNPDLQRVIDQVVDDRHVIRASTVISLATRIDYRTLPLVTEAISRPLTGS
jgi:DNA-binding Lrp family transcriptional regulator